MIIVALNYDVPVSKYFLILLKPIPYLALLTPPYFTICRGWHLKYPERIFLWKKWDQSILRVRRLKATGDMVWRSPPACCGCIDRSFSSFYRTTIHILGWGWGWEWYFDTTYRYTVTKDKLKHSDEYKCVLCLEKSCMANGKPGMARLSRLIG